MRRPWPIGGCSAMESEIIIIIIIIITGIIITKSETTSETGARRERNCSEKSVGTTGNKLDLFHEKPNTGLETKRGTPVAEFRLSSH
jgi:hypothetical protein